MENKLKIKTIKLKIVSITFMQKECFEGGVLLLQINCLWFA